MHSHTHLVLLKSLFIPGLVVIKFTWWAALQVPPPSNLIFSSQRKYDTQHLETKKQKNTHNAWCKEVHGNGSITYNVNMSFMIRIMFIMNRIIINKTLTKIPSHSLMVRSRVLKADMHLVCKLHWGQHSSKVMTQLHFL